MGITNSKYKKHNVISLKICSFYADMKNTISTKHNIDKIINYFFSVTNGHKIDVLCLQGIDSALVRNQIITGFKNEVDRFNIKIDCKIKKKLEILGKIKSESEIEEERTKLNKILKIELFYYPYDEQKEKQIDYGETWSLDDVTSYDPNLYEKLIISRYKSIINISENIYDTSLSTENTHFIHKKGNIQVINIDIDNIFVSIYNIDVINIENDFDFKQFTEKMKRIIEFNKESIKLICYEKKIKIQNFHILCGNFGITEIKNNAMNRKYIKLMKEMNFIDILRYITHLRKKNLIKYTYSTNIFGTRNNFIMLLSNIFLDFNNIMNISEIIYQDNGIINVDAYVDEIFNDIFLNYPTTVMILLSKIWINSSEQDDEILQKYISYKEIDMTDEQIRNIIDSEYENDID